MRKFWRAWIMAIPVAILGAALIGCSGGGTGSGPTKSEGGTGSDTGTAGSEMKAIVAKGKATIKGKVTYDGTPPEATPIDITGKTDAALCAKEPPKDQRWQVDPASKGIMDVYVWVRPVEKNEYFDCSAIADKYKGEVKLDQPVCAFHPHGLLFFPEYRDPKDGKKKIKTGQTFIVGNEFEKPHNTKISGPLGFAFNQTIEPKTSKTVTGITASYDTPYTINCTIHPWMSAYAWALEHPYAAISGKDGSFEIKDVPVPPGGKLKFVAWHEEKRWVFGSANGEAITVEDGKTVEKNFTLKK